jgi:DsbC/DsbD-like thiol-disulfide interchange protein
MKSALALAIVVLATLSGAAGAGELRASAWSDFREASVRLLIEPAKPGDAVLRGAVEIRMIPGFKTYWRNAGDSGVPPAFDFSKTAWLSAVDVRFPFPGRFDDGAGGTAFGYVGHALLPFEAKVTAPAGPLHLKLDFAVCGTMCIPLSGEIALDPARASPAGRETEAALATARKRVPVPLDAAVARAKIALERDSSAPKPRWFLTFTIPLEQQGFLVFPEGKTFLITEKSKTLPNGDFRVVLTGDPPLGSDGRFGMARLTFGDARQAHEVSVDLDTGAVAP